LGVFDGRDGPRAGQARRPLARQVLARVDGDDAGHLRGRGRVDAADARVRERAAHHHEPGHARQRQVLGVAALAGDQLGVLLAWDAVSNEALAGVGGGGHGFVTSCAPAGAGSATGALRAAGPAMPRISAPPCWTALTMLW